MLRAILAGTRSHSATVGQATETRPLESEQSEKSEKSEEPDESEVSEGASSHTSPEGESSSITSTSVGLASKREALPVCILSTATRSANANARAKFTFLPDGYTIEWNWDDDHSAATSTFAQSAPDSTAIDIAAAQEARHISHGLPPEESYPDPDTLTEDETWDRLNYFNIVAQDHMERTGQLAGLADRAATAAGRLEDSGTMRPMTMAGYLCRAAEDTLNEIIKTANLTIREACDECDPERMSDWWLRQADFSDQTDLGYQSNVTTFETIAEARVSLAEMVTLFNNRSLEVSAELKRIMDSQPDGSEKELSTEGQSTDSSETATFTESEKSSVGQP